MTLWLHWWNAIFLLRPAFSRLRSFLWFVTAVAGLTLRTEHLGVTSIVRALGLKPALYDSTPRHVAMSWARRLKRVFGVEIESCTRCGGELKIIASIAEPQLIAKILSHLARAAPEQSQSALPLGARGPPAQSSLL